MDIRPAVPDEHDAIRALLMDGGLPVQDLDTSAITFTAASDGDRVVGVIGLECFGEAGLLRSLTVAPDCRRSGTGARLVDAVEELARARGLHTLALLTQTAEAFFVRRGYHVVERSHAPPSVQASAEFRSICPSSATCMIKRLDAGAAASIERQSAPITVLPNRDPAP